MILVLKFTEMHSAYFETTVKQHFIHFNILKILTLQINTWAEPSPAGLSHPPPSSQCTWPNFLIWIYPPLVDFKKCFSYIYYYKQEFTRNE